MHTFRKFRLAFIGCVLLSCSPVEESEDLRAVLNARLQEDHVRSTYAQTYDVMESIYEDPEDPANVILWYTGRSQPKSLRVNQDGRDGWNREHLWPQSLGTRLMPMRSDLHHLRPADASINSRRGALYFDTGGSPIDEAPETFADADSFEPRDAIKGDIARALFYVDVRYEGKGGEPDLVLLRNSVGGVNALGNLCTLLTWHREDPPDTAERLAHDRAAALQGNRNAFIDEPDLAEALYAPSC